MIRWHFRKVTIHGGFNDRGLPVMLVGNHFSWWDGFIANLLNSRVFKRKFHVMMLEEELENRMFLNKAGAYSIRKGSRSVLESLNYTVEILDKNENLVVLYPQGVFESVYKYPVCFEKGIGSIFSRIPNKIHLVFYVALTDYFSHRKPSLQIYLKEVPQDQLIGADTLESEYNAFLSDCIMQQKPG